MAQHQENANGLLNGSPWWVKAGVYFGLPSLGFGFLLWYITLGPAGDDVRAAAKNTTELKESISTHIKHTEDLHDVFEEYMKANTLLMRKNCVHTAKLSGDNPDECLR